jgi:glycosyltransferase involved in cell wall biosynthesis
MKLLFIKIGKAWHVLRREGLVRGGYRIIRSLKGFFLRVYPGDVLFITGGVGDSARYRCHHTAEELRLHGFLTSVTVQDNPFLSSYADKFSVFVFHRVLLTKGVARCIARIKEQDKEIIFETDDLVYDPEFLKHMDYFTTMNALERKLYEHGVGGEILADPYVKICTTSTMYLAEKLREHGKQVFVIKNKVSQEDVERAEKILNDVHRDVSVVRVGYLSGTPSHNKDFSTITEALGILLGKYPEMRLVLAGPLDTANQLSAFEKQIERVPFAPRKEYFETVAKLDINLAPLEIGNPFCESKSELKWFETGLVGVPTVAAATGTFKEAITEGVDGYTATTTEAWVEKVGRLVVDAPLRRKMGDEARKTVLEKYATMDADNVEYYEYLKSRISN